MTRTMIACIERLRQGIGMEGGAVVAPACRKETYAPSFEDQPPAQKKESESEISITQHCENELDASAHIQY